MPSTGMLSRIDNNRFLAFPLILKQYFGMQKAAATEGSTNEIYSGCGKKVSTGIEHETHENYD
jgi:hypothetical protein